MMNEDFPELADFKGTARLFPLPNLVLFPCMLQALHIYEPRYRQMTADALAGDRLIALALLRPGWEGHYEGQPALYSVACLGKIIAEQELNDGRYNLQLRGLSRIRIVRELEDDKPYRSAQVELLPDAEPPVPETDASLRDQFTRLIPAWCSAQGIALDVFDKILKSQLSLGTVSDVISFALPLPFEFKQKLLEAQNVGHRVSELLRYLEQNRPEAPSQPAGAADRKFPPDFSTN